MESAHFKVLFDVPEDKRDEVAVSGSYICFSPYNFEDSAVDNPVTVYPLTIGTAYGTLHPVSTSAGIAFYEEDVFRPLDNPRALLYERYTDKGELYFAMKDGMMLEALVFPYRLDKEQGAELLGTITKIQKELQARVDAEAEEPQE